MDKKKLLRQSMTLSLSLQQAEAGMKAKNSELVQAYENYKRQVASLNEEKEQLRKWGFDVDEDTQDGAETNGKFAENSDIYSYSKHLEVENESLKAQLNEQCQRTRNAVTNVRTQHEFAQEMARERDSAVNELMAVKRSLAIEHRSADRNLVLRQKQEIDEYQQKLRSNQELLNRFQIEKKNLDRLNWQQNVEIDKLRKATTHLTTQSSVQQEEITQLGIKNKELLEILKKYQAFCEDVPSKAVALSKELLHAQEKLNEEAKQNQLLLVTNEQQRVEIRKLRKSETKNKELLDVIEKNKASGTVIKHSKIADIRKEFELGDTLLLDEGVRRQQALLDTVEHPRVELEKLCEAEREVKELLINVVQNKQSALEEKSKLVALQQELEKVQNLLKKESQHKKMLLETVDQQAVELIKSRNVNIEIKAQFQHEMSNRKVEIAIAKAELEAWEYQEALRGFKSQNRSDALEYAMEPIRYRCSFC